MNGVADLKQGEIGDRVLSREASEQDRCVDRLIEYLPRRLQTWMRWIRQPSCFWIRMPAGMALICGGLLGFLPVLGFWMLPLALLLLADDIALLRSAGTGFSTGSTGGIRVVFPSPPQFACKHRREMTIDDA